MIDWEWFADHNTYRVFTYLLLMANYKPNTWRGIEVMAGEHITSTDILAQKLGLTRQMVRTSLNKLKSTGEITTTSTNKYTIITIVKLGLYQNCDYGDNQQNSQRVNHEVTNDQSPKQPDNNHK